jgi:hypothetical protein
MINAILRDRWREREHVPGSRECALTKASAIPLLSGLSMGVVLGSRPMSRAKPARIAGDVAAAVVGQPFDGDRQVVDPAEPMLDGRHHQVTNVVAGHAARCGKEPHGCSITAVQRESDKRRERAAIAILADAVEDDVERARQDAREVFASVVDRRSPGSRSTPHSGRVRCPARQAATRLQGSSATGLFGERRRHRLDDRRWHPYRQDCAALQLYNGGIPQCGGGARCNRS